MTLLFFFLSLLFLLFWLFFSFKVSRYFCFFDWTTAVQRVKEDDKFVFLRFCLNSGLTWRFRKIGAQPGWNQVYVNSQWPEGRLKFRTTGSVLTHMVNWGLLWACHDSRFQPFDLTGYCKFLSVFPPTFALSTQTLHCNFVQNYGGDKIVIVEVSDITINRMQVPLQPFRY